MISRRRKCALWLALTFLVCLSAYGSYSWRLFEQQVWHPIGLERLMRFACLYVAWFLVLGIVRRRYFAPVTLAVALAYTILAVGIVPLLSVLYFLFSAWMLGRLVLRGMPESPLDDLLALLTGVSIYMLLVSTAVHFPVNFPAVYAAALAVPIAWNRRAVLPSIRRAAAVLRPSQWSGWSAHLALGLAAFVLLAHWLVVLKPEVGGDALAMHLVIPASVAAHHRWAFDFQHVVWAVMPMGADWCFTAVHLLGGEYAARLLNLGMFLVVAALLYNAIRRWLSPGASHLLIALFAATPVVQLVTGSLLVENVWAALLFGAVVALWRHHDRTERRYLYLAAVLLGAGMATKFGALAFVLAAGIWVAVEIRRPGKRPVSKVAAAALTLALFLLFALPPYAAAYIKTGNPVFPFMNAVFKSPYFDSAASFADHRFETALSWRTPYEITFHTGKFMEGQNGAWGFHYLLLFPLGLIAVRRKWPYLGWVALSISLLFSFLTFRVQANLRYIYPAFPLFMLVIALLFDTLRTGDRMLYRAIAGLSASCVIANVYFLPASNWYHKDFYLNWLGGRADADNYVRDSAPVRNLVDYLNRAHPGAPVGFFESNQIAGLRARAFTNSWHNDSFNRRLRFSASSLDCLRLANDLGLRFFIAPTKESGFPIPQASIRAFLSEFTVPEHRSGRYYVARLKDAFAGEKGWQNVGLLEAGLLPSPPGPYDDFSRRIAFSEGWTRDQQFERTSNRTLTYSNAAGASFRFLFRGTEITYVYTRAPNRGIAEVEIDGVKKGRIDLYAPDVQWQSRSKFDGLAASAHTVLVRVLKAKNRASVDNFVDVDALIVR